MRRAKAEAAARSERALDDQRATLEHTYARRLKDARQRHEAALAFVHANLKATFLFVITLG